MKKRIPTYLPRPLQPSTLRGGSAASSASIDIETKELARVTGGLVGSWIANAIGSGASGDA